MSEIKIKIENLYKIFGSRPREYTDIVRDGVDKDELLSKYNHVLGLDNISLDIKEHSIQVVMGLSGSGKSTLIRHINRLIEPTEGTVTVDGEDITKLNKMDLLEFRRNKTGMVFNALHYSSSKYIRQCPVWIEHKNLDKSDSIERAMYWIEKVGLTGFENKFPNQLSGGMQQRVGLARALATDPDILLMDEAFSALDPLIRTDMQDQLLDLQKNLNKTIMFITHDLDEALKLGDRIAILNGGKLVQDGNAEEILLKPADQYVANFVKDVNRIKVLKIKTILDQGGERTNSNPTVNVNDSIENCLPAILESQFGLNVIDEKNNFVGSVSKNKIIDILQKSKD